MVLDLKPALVSSQYDISLIPNILQLRILSICEHSPIPNIILYACLTRVAPTYVSLYNLSQTDICMSVQPGFQRHTYECTTWVRQTYVCVYEPG